MEFKNKKLSIYITLFLVPLLLMEFKVVATSNARPALMIGILQLFLFIISLRYIKDSINLILNKKSITYIVFITIFSGLIIFSVNFTHLRNDALRASFLFLAPSIMLVLMTLADRNKEETFLFLSKFLAVFGFLVSAYGIIIFFFGEVSGSTQYIELGGFRFSQVLMGTNKDRITAVTSNPNVLGSLLMITIPMTYYNVVEAKTNKKYFLFVFIQLIGLLMTQSRASIVGLITMIAIYVYLSNRRKMKFYYFGLFLLVMGIALLAFFGEAALGRLADGLNGREEQWVPLIRNIIEYPFTGVGFGLADIVIINQETHNVYLNILAETGVFGLLTFLSIWFFGISRNYQKINVKKMNNENANQLILIFSILSGLVIHQLFETDLLQYDFITLFWVYLITYSVQPKYSYVLRNGHVGLRREMPISNIPE